MKKLFAAALALLALCAGRTLGETDAGDVGKNDAAYQFATIINRMMINTGCMEESYFTAVYPIEETGMLSFVSDGGGIRLLILPGDEGGIDSAVFLCEEPEDVRMMFNMACLFPAVDGDLDIMPALAGWLDARYPLMLESCEREEPYDDTFEDSANFTAELVYILSEDLSRFHIVINRP